MSDARKFERFVAHLDVEIRIRGRGQVCPSLNVSRHGMYVRCDSPPQERQLLILRIPLPDGLPPIDVMASVVRHATPGDADIGMGLNFFALTEENKQRWEAYLSGLRGEAPRPVDPKRNGHRPTFLLQPKDRDRLKLFEAREFALGTMFLRTPVLRKLGESLQVVLLHPESDEEFPLLARVRKLHEGGNDEPKGMTLDFDSLDEQVRIAFHTFVEEGVGMFDGTAYVAESNTGVHQRPPSAAPQPPPPPEEALESSDDLPDAPGAEPLPRPSLLEAEADADLALQAAGAADRTSIAERVESSEAPPDREAAPPPSPPTSPGIPVEVEGATVPPPPSAPFLASSLGIDIDALVNSALVASGETSGGSSGGSSDAPAQSRESSFQGQSTAASTAATKPARGIEVAALREALGAQPDDVQLLFRLGSHLARERDTADEAIPLLQRLLTLEPLHPLGNGSLALAYAQIGQKSAAQRHLSRARRLGQTIDTRIVSLLQE